MRSDQATKPDHFKPIKGLQIELEFNAKEDHRDHNVVIKETFENILIPIHIRPRLDQDHRGDGLIDFFLVYEVNPELAKEKDIMQRIKRAVVNSGSLRLIQENQAEIMRIPTLEVVGKDEDGTLYEFNPLLVKSFCAGAMRQVFSRGVVINVELIMPVRRNSEGPTLAELAVINGGQQAPLSMPNIYQALAKYLESNPDLQAKVLAHSSPRLCLFRKNDGSITPITLFSENNMTQYSFTQYLKGFGQ